MTLGLDSLLSGAFLTGQRKLKTVAQNDVNQGNPSYCRLDMQTQTCGVGAHDMSVTISKTRRIVDPVLLKNLSDAQTDLAKFRTTAETYGLLESYLGPVGEQAHNLSTKIAAFFDVLTTPALAQDQDAYMKDLVTKAGDLARGFSDFSHKIQILRSDTDQKIGLTVRDVQSLLDEYHALNLKIQRSEPESIDLFMAKDRQDQIYLELSDYFDVEQTSDRYPVDHLMEQNYLWGPDGCALVTRKGANTISFNPVGMMLPEYTLDGGNLSPIKVHFDDVVIDITSKMRSGSLSAMFDARDTVLPDLQAVLDRGASVLADTLNAIHTQGASHTPNSILTSSRILDPLMPLVTHEAQLRVATLDEHGQVIDLRDFPLEVGQTLNDLVANLNTIDGVVARFQGGHLQVAVADTADGKPRGIAMCGLADETRDLVIKMGLNDLFWSKEDHILNDSNVQPGFAYALRLNPSIENNPRLFAHGFLSDHFPLGVDMPGVQKADGANLNLLAQEKEKTWTFGAAGHWSEKYLRPVDWGRLFVTGIAQESKEADQIFKTQEMAVSGLLDERHKAQGVDPTQCELDKIRWSTYLQNIISMMGMERSLHMSFLQVMRGF